MTVIELINALKKFPEDMEVVDIAYMIIEDVYESTWVDSNYPDKRVVVID